MLIPNTWVGEHVAG